jgi:hypothetical protein
MFSDYTHYFYTISFILDVNKRPPSPNNTLIGSDMKDRQEKLAITS